MAAADEQTRATSSSIAAPVQLPKHVQKRAKKLAWLTDAELERADERLARLEGDRELAALLHAAGFKGRDYIAFANEIAKYGVAVIRGWIYKGEIWGKVKGKGFGALEPEPWPGALIEDAEGVADETIVLALKGFRETVLLPGKWDPSKGASLRTFFVGQCLLRFSNVYKAWRREQIRSFVPTAGLDVFEDGPTATPPTDPSSRAALIDEVRRALGKVTDERARAAFYLKAIHGSSYREIGEKLSMTEKAVESAIGRARQQVQNGENIA